MMKNNSSQLIIISIIFSFLICAKSSAQGLEYFGQNPPGMTPVRFPPASLLANDDWFWHGSPVFSPDLMEMYWAKYTIYPTYQRIELAFVEVEDTQWTQLQIPLFADLNYGENNPGFSESGDTLYFISTRPGGFIFYVSRTPTGWSQPVSLNIPLRPNSATGWQFSITRDKTIYFEIWANNGSSPPDIYRTKYVNGQYTIPENIGMSVNTDGNEFNPYVDPDERFLIFVTNRPGGYGLHDLYLSSRNQDGTWSDPINLGPEINSDQDDAAPYISPDGLYFFFNAWKTGDLGYNPYWVDAQIVYNLITDVDEEINSEGPVTFQLYQNYPNPFNPTTKITYSIPERSFVSLKVYDVLGSEVASLVDEVKLTGEYLVEFEANGLTSGIYLYRLKTEDNVKSHKMVLIK
ncbi:MAG: T9SS type A sorting domain-containing protein [Candidatus Kariarchaeaceae archaeon]|jgi:hypothetical protein